MYRFLNYVNRKWNNTVFLFHDIATKTNINWVVKLSIWAHDNMIWQLPEKKQLIGGVSVRELRLERELELANHQIQYWINYSSELQDELLKLFPEEDSETEQEKKREVVNA